MCGATMLLLLLQKRYIYTLMLLLQVGYYVTMQQVGYYEQQVMIQQVGYYIQQVGYYIYNKWVTIQVGCCTMLLVLLQVGA